MSTRRYGDDEVREIFARATTGSASEALTRADSGGMTLDEITQIGREAGIEAAHVAQAAASLDAQVRVPKERSSFGMRIGVSRVVDLPRAPTDREWEQMIAGFRTTFDTRGVATSVGGMRDWSQGNLHICVEPTAHGHQLRLSTRKEDAIALNGLGAVMAGMSAVIGGAAAAGGKPEKALVLIVMFAGVSLAAFGGNLLRLPRWRREREQQMEQLAEHAVRMLSEPVDG